MVSRCFVSISDASFLQESPIIASSSNDYLCPADHGPLASHLESQCHALLNAGLATSTRCSYSSAHCSYSSAQDKFWNFCVMNDRLDSHGLALPASEWTLCLFATSLAPSLRYSSIKVYLSAVRSLHIDHGLPEPTN